jgi:hypothetical protein
VRRALLTLAVVLLTLQASGLSSWLFPVACDEQCEEDGGGPCSPTCSCGVCCAYGRSLVRSESARAAPVLEATRLSSVLAAKVPASPPPREIFRVPRARLA